MEQLDTLTGMLDLMAYPAFCVKDGTVAYANRPALACMLTEGTPVSQILFTGAEEYSQFEDGCLYLTLCICDTYPGASVTRMGEFDIFVLEPTDNLATLQGLALAAQELRLPLANVMTVTDKLFPQLEDAANTDAEEQMARINKGLFQLLRIVSNMSDAHRYCQLPSGGQEVVNICDYLEELFSATAELAQEAGIMLNFQNLTVPVFSLADPDKLQRAVSNILSNAMKFTPKGGKIDAKLSRRGNMLYLTIQDSGSCVPENLRGSIFSRYQRHPEIEDSRNGIGLGMVLVRSTAAIHGGTVLLEYPKDSGTRVTMTLAIRQKTDPAVQSPIFRVDYAGERDHRLLELSDVLPHALYKPNKIN
ncbi:MAG: HAMP domain-containing histidine kinase [Oscillospiraceae bacterium]|nr:HAMP domain-containing histidine kinase [Oscillospiraceae bacterium]